MKQLVNEYIEVIAELKSLTKLGDYSGLLGLIERTQTWANRMEAALEKNNQLEEIEEKRKEAKEALRELEAEIKDLEKKKEQLDD